MNWNIFGIAKRIPSQVKNLINNFLEKLKMLTYTYVDNSNFFIEGQRVAATQKGMAIDIDDAIDRGIFDFSFQPDYGKLHKIVCGDKKDIGHAKLWGSPPPTKDSFWDMLDRKGFKVTKYEKSFGKERKVDTAIAYQMGIDAQEIDKSNSEICLVAGDKDFVPAVKDLIKRGYKVNVFFWGHAAKELRSAASNFISLDDFFDDLKYVKSP